MNKIFMLKSPVAQRLYNDYARDLPVIDYHNHLPLQALRENKHFENIQQMWISADPYKHRLMRISGVEEKYITGNGTDFEKFSAWCRIYPMLLGTPVYDWCKMELEKVFECDIPMCAENAEKLWELLNEKVKKLTPKGLLESFKVEYAVPCHGLTEDVSFYENEASFAPSLRCDDIVMPTAALAETLGSLAGTKIVSFGDYCKALEIRMDYFVRVGCQFADISLDNGFKYTADFDESYFEKAISGTATETEKNALKCEIVRFIGAKCAEKGIALQLHMGAQRETSERLLGAVGKAGGFAGIGEDISIKGLTSLLNYIEKQKGCLPKIILFTLNPVYNAPFAILSGSYSKDGTPSVVTQGPAWWWCDHKHGMEQFFDEFSVYSVLATFVGMTTDSRSFLSFVRHDYFRRVFCSWLADKVEKGDYPEDYKVLGEIIYKVCYGNAKDLVKEI